MAAQRGLCKPEQCDVFAQLNPYQRYSYGWDELIRQGYALGDIQAWSASIAYRGGEHPRQLRPR
ncbi:MAG: hypothetical protein EBX49_07875 [Synechococcaceae bacterium WB8_1B_136]|nr:hypothetical protein [Synechococcaceae bacterium WB8_1B_136]